ncbi:MAG TPA: hypothetical protein VFM37_16835 [Pseudonocardiaceae bacterium]|nr:hypothetical protein [Pseudonocardiaceae bacterium]
MAILGFAALVAGATLAVALGLTVAGVAHPATLTNLLLTGGALVG